MPSEASIEDYLSQLIGLSGKLRMLSHRAAMFALTPTTPQQSPKARLERFDASCEEYRAISAMLRLDAPRKDGSEGARQRLREAKTVSKEQQIQIDRFLQEAKTVRAALAGAEEAGADLPSNFANFVADDLLETLDAVNAGVRRALQLEIASKRTDQNDGRNTMDEAVTRIENISAAVRLIAVNAAVEAARAGPAGRGFGVIAAEIKELSENAAKSARDVRARISPTSSS